MRRIQSQTMNRQEFVQPSCHGLIVLHTKEPPRDSGLVRDYIAPDYPKDHPIIPHGISVALNAPAVFRFTASSNPQRHLEAAKALGADITGAKPEDAGEIIAQTVIGYFKRFNLPNGLKDVGFSESDIPKLVEGTLPQHRVTKLSPRPAGAEELAGIFKEAMQYW